MLPFNEDFSDNETGATPPLDDCWIRGTNSTTSIYPYVSSIYSNDNSNCLFFNSQVGTYCYVALPEFEDDVSNLILNCSIRRYQNANYNSDLVLGLMSNPYDITTFTAYDTLRPIEFGEWSDFQISLANYNNEDGSHITFLLPGDSKGNSYLDNITIDSRGSCDSPTDPKVVSISSNAAVVTWSDTIANEWMVYCGLPGFSIDTIEPITATDTHNVEIPNLLPSTTYEFYVLADCDNGDYSAPCLPVTFTTACAPITVLPYTEDFEDYLAGESSNIDPCWHKQAIGTGTNYPYIHSTDYINGRFSLYFNAKEATGTKYNCYAALPIFDESISDLTIRFWMKNHFINANTNYVSKLALGVMSNPEDISTFDTLTIFDMSDKENDAVQLQEYFFDEYTGNKQYIALLALDVESVGSYAAENSFLIDDVTIDYIPSCFRPEEITISNIEATTATISWNGNAPSYEVMYSTHNDMSDSTIVSTTTNSIQLTNLHDYTYYYIKVRSVCDVSDYSDWTYTATIFRTTIDCGEGYHSFIDTIGNGITANSSYVIDASTTHSAGCNWMIYPFEELTTMGLVGNDNTIRTIALETKNVGQEMPLKIYMAETDLEEFNSTISDTIARDQMTLVFDDTVQFKANSWNEIILEAPFNYHNSTNLVIAIARNGQISSSSEFCYSSVGNYRTAYCYTTRGTNAKHRQKYLANMIFKVCGDIPNCIKPRNIVKTSCTATSIDLAWEGSADSYQIVYSDNNFNPDNITTEQIELIANETNINLQNLTPNTTYYIYMRSHCGDEYSIWANPLIITTPCEAIDLPYSENFDNYPSGSSVLNGQTMDPCWVKCTNGNMAYPYINNTYKNSEPNSLSFYGNNETYSYAALPQFTEPINNTTMTFKLFKSAASYGTMHVGVMTDPYDANTFERVATVKPQDKNTWENFEVSFADYTGEGHYIAFMMPDSVKSYAQIDDIEVFAIPSCQAPINIVVPDSTITSTSAIVYWTDRETPTNGYELEYGPYGFTLGMGTRVQSNSNPTTLTNLPPSSHLDVYVRDICFTIFKVVINGQCYGSAFGIERGYK